MSTDFPSPDKKCYVVTFYSHFGAVRFKRSCDARKITAKIMPVPRNLSSSCGTCVRCEREEQKACAADSELPEPGSESRESDSGQQKSDFHIAEFVPDSACLEEIEQVALALDKGYQILYRAENS
ncbi:MAG: DUF3343 domain-containing protein [Eubacteriales bacterium]|nr:DUF3343 domain-containing protein [Eubacteriales bacterium]